MIGHPRTPQPDRRISEIGHILTPLVIFPREPLAMHYLGVPIVIGVSSPAHYVLYIAMIAVHDEDYERACQKLKDYGFRAIFEYPTNHNLAGGLKLNLTLNSFADITHTVSTKGYDIIGNICHPLKEPLVESLARGVLADQDDENAEFSNWGNTMSTWVAMMCAYLEVNNYMLDSCSRASSGLVQCEIWSNTREVWPLRQTCLQVIEVTTSFPGTSLFLLEFVPVSH
ncbi:hypothetical protein N7447_009325 [Penicillium robsamsonii]|uniref:uncharacterized protein n=1 Tax=Penicillium robsamsonii TaxID=1792511 RepID=UPI002548C094|nr:uncharacterized protein N7447_009325 [Penicillium robsamsonii]KAJ5817092.1 hypothetical protein N7447_009325 [Penicillium robsamsonii]